jgi:DsbC/DsbD-like thiol-disulfide interchange protein
MKCMFSRVLLPLLLSCAATGAYAADAYSTDWASASKAEARLVAGGPRTAALEIRLAPGAITYWRNPGDAGVPPVFDFSASVNLLRAETQFPAPTRIAEPDGSEAFGYSDDVVFPITIEPIDPSKPVTLALKAGYAVCEKLCLPAKADLTLSLPASAETPYASAIGAASALTPRPVGWKSLGGELASVDANDWRLCVPGQSGPARDLFLEAPSGWWFSAKAEPRSGGRDCFSIALHDKPADGALPVSARATITGGSGALDVTLSLGPKS